MQNNSWNNSNQYYGQQNRSGGGLNNSNGGQWHGGQGQGHRRNNLGNQNNHGGVGDGNRGHESFHKFRDPQRHPKQNKRQGSRRAGGGSKHRHNSGGYSGPRRERRGVHGNSGPPGTLFFYDNKGNSNPPSDQTVIGSTPLEEGVQFASNSALALTAPMVEKQIVTAPHNQDGPADQDQSSDTKQAPPVVHIKQEKRDISAKKAVEKSKKSSDESSSSGSDESFEAGEVVKAASTPKAVTKTAAGDTSLSSSSSSSSSSSESESEDKLVNPAKKKPLKKDQTLIKSSSKKLRKIPSEDDVVCMGQEKRHYTIPDEDEEDEDDEDETDGSKKIVGKRKSKDKSIDVCSICDKKGHTSFQCQMICRNCSALYHSFKNCPNPPNLGVALQLFMEFNMQQLAMFNIEQRFNFPSATATSAITTTPLSTPGKCKKYKKSLSKKTKKILKKKMKLEEDKDNTDESGNDNNALVAASDDSDEEEVSSESSDEPQPTLPIKQKRKRSSKQQQQVTGAGNFPPPHQAFPFPILAPGTPFNSMMYPYGAAFSYPK